ncbi:MAG: hypothetical protein LBH96_05005 [Candidatus Peribacteria bacterium]|nr:hypothetical protein [Candidatus Peribacteria bacterium]
MAQLINVHKKLEHIEQQEHQHSEAELTEKGDIQPNSNKKQDFILENTFSETSMKNAKSRAVSLETYLSAYSNGIGKEEKINFTKLYDDLSKIAEGKSYKPTNKMITQLIEPKIERYPHTEEQNKEIDQYF